MESSVVRRWHALVLTACVICASASPAATFDLRYGGRLADSSGAPVAGPVDLTFRFYRDTSGGAALVTLQVPGVSLEDGVFNAPIRLTPDDADKLFEDGDRPIYIEVESQGQTYPRQMFSYVPLALRVPVDGSKIVYNSDGKLTLGPDAPTGSTSLSGVTASGGVESLGNQTYGTFLLTNAGKALVGAADAAAQRTLLGLGVLDGVSGPIQTQLNGKLSLSGGVMTGALDMGGTNKVINLADPSGPGDATRKSYVDSKLGGQPLTTGTPGAESNGKVIKWDGSQFILGADEKGESGSGIISLGGLNGTTQYFGIEIPGVSSGTLPSWTPDSATSTHKLVIPMASAAGVGAGLISKSEFETLTSKQGAITSSSVLDAGSLSTNRQNGLELKPYSSAAGNTSELRFRELSAAGSEYVGFRAPDAVGSNTVWTLPPADGVGGYVLSTNGSGTLSWISPTTGSVTRIETGTGLSGGPVQGVGTISLANVGTAGTYTKVTTNTQGQVTSGSALTESDIPSLNASKITTGSISVALGGTGATSFTNNGIVVGSGASPLSATAAGTQYQVLRAEVGGAPAFGAVSLDQAAAVTGTLSLANGGTGSSTASGARTNLGLGTAATLNAGTAASNLVQLDGAGKLPAVDGSQLTGLVSTFGSTMTGTLNLPANGLVAGTNQLVLSGGNVGIGTTTTLAKLDVAGGGRFASQNGIELAPYGILAGNTSELRFDERAANGANYVGFRAADALASNVIWTLPVADGTSGQVLSTNGTGALSWVSGLAPTGAASGDLSGTFPGPSVVNVGGKTSSQIATSVNDTAAATNANTVSTIVKRDASGNFSAGTITATLSGNATNVTGTVAIANGGTGATTAGAAFDALSPLTTLGDILFANTGGTDSRLAGNTSTTKMFLSSTGNGTTSAAPAWGALSAADVPNHDASKITSGTLAVSQGGTGAATGAANTVFAAPNGSAGAPSFRTLVASDIPNLDADKISTGTLANSVVNWAAPGAIGATTANTGAFSTITTTGNVGIGTTLPSSPLTVQGMIESKAGGVKYPDGTVQTTANASYGCNISKAATFDGVTTYLSVPSSVPAQWNSSGFTGLTFAVWADFQSTGSYTRLFDFGNGQSSSNVLFGRSGTSSNLYFSVLQGSNGQIFTTSGGITNGTLTHYAVTLTSSGSVKIFKNGTLLSSGTIQLPTNFSLSSNFIGKSNWSADAMYYGNMSDVQIYNVALADADIPTIMSGTPKNNLIARYLVNSDTKDSSGNSRDATLSGYQSYTTRDVACGVSVNQWAFNGSNLYYSSGNVGVGTTVPASAMDINGDITMADKIIHSGDTNTAIRFPAVDTITAETNGSERLRITSTGNVGIGTTAPSAQLGVNGVISLSQQASAPAATSSEGKIYTKTDGNLYYLDGSGAETKLSPKAPDYILITHEVADGTGGGSITANTWNVRPFNTVKQSGGGSASVSSNVITLTAGTYDCEINSVTYEVGTTQARLYNVSTSTVVAYGTVQGNSYFTNPGSIIKTRLTLTGSTQFRVEQNAAGTRANDGFGVASAFTGSPETYALFECKRY
jgi:hypothetical protein